MSTPWYLRLDPRAIATDNQPWIFDNWFRPNGNGRTPVFVSCPWGYTKPADTLARLDDWADQIPQLAVFPRLDLPFDSTQERIEHPTVKPWCFFGSTAWTRKIADFTPDVLPYHQHSTYVHFCAQRRNDHFVRVQLKDFGWEHHFRSPRWFLDRCKQLLR